MADYTKTTDFASKDALNQGDPNKVIQGTEIDDEFDAIETAVATKANTASPTFTGTVTGVDFDISGTVTADTINEDTADAGVTIEGVVLKDNGITATGTVDLSSSTLSLGTLVTVDVDGGTIDGAVIGGTTPAAITGTDITGNDVITDTVSEKTATAGVTVDGLLIKDGSIPEAAVTEHEAAITITQSQVSDLVSALTKASDYDVEAGTSRTLAAGDGGSDIFFTSGSAVTVTVPTDLAVGFQCTLSQLGAGTVTITSSDNLNGSSSDVALPTQWSAVWLVQYSEGNWLVSGV